MDRKEERKQLELFKTILHSGVARTGGNGRGPTELMDHLYIGSLKNAQDTRLLKRLRVTHVVNMAAYKDYSRSLSDCPYDPDSGIQDYLPIEAIDNFEYPIMMHFHKVKSFIDRAEKQGGRALVHCELGVNRSGAMCVAYMMVKEGITLHQALRRARIQRPIILCNEGFQKQLIQYAYNEGLLYKD